MPQNPLDPNKALVTAHKIGIVLLPEFSDLVLTLIRELLRISQLTQLCRFDVILISRDGSPVRASNGFQCDVDGDLTARDRLDAVLVCASYNPMDYFDRRLSGWLRKQHRHGAVIAGVDTGSLFLAEAGLLDGRKATLHWDELTMARVQYPKVDFVSGLVVRDGPFLTSCGSLGTIEFALDLIAQFAGRHVADLVIGLTGRNRTDGQDPTLSPKVAQALALMQANLEAPLSVDQIAKTIGVSQRQLVRHFQAAFGASPVAHYAAVRLDYADDLLRKTRFSVSEVAQASGFASLSWFSKSYAQRFGCTPSQARLGARG